VFRYIPVAGELNVAASCQLAASRQLFEQAGSLPYEKYEQIET
jgi:hypothetical protein